MKNSSWIQPLVFSAADAVDLYSVTATKRALPVGSAVQLHPKSCVSVSFPVHFNSLVFSIADLPF